MDRIAWSGHWGQCWLTLSCRPHAEDEEHVNVCYHAPESTDLGLVAGHKCSCGCDVNGNYERANTNKNDRCSPQTSVQFESKAR